MSKKLRFLLLILFLGCFSIFIVVFCWEFFTILEIIFGVALPFLFISGIGWLNIKNMKEK